MSRRAAGIAARKSRMRFFRPGRAPDPAVYVTTLGHTAATGPVGHGRGLGGRSVRSVRLYRARDMAASVQRFVTVSHRFISRPVLRNFSECTIFRGPPLPPSPPVPLGVGPLESS